MTSTAGSSLINHMLVVHLVCGEPMTLGAKIRRRLGREEIMAIGALLTLVVTGGEGLGHSGVTGAAIGAQPGAWCVGAVAEGALNGLSGGMRGVQQCIRRRCMALGAEVGRLRRGGQEIVAVHAGLGLVIAGSQCLHFSRMARGTRSRQVGTRRMGTVTRSAGQSLGRGVCGMQQTIGRCTVTLRTQTRSRRGGCQEIVAVGAALRGMGTAGHGLRL